MAGGTERSVGRLTACTAGTAVSADAGVDGDQSSTAVGYATATLEEEVGETADARDGIRTGVTGTAARGTNDSAQI